MNKGTVFLFFLTLLFSCGKKGNTQINGTFSGQTNQMVYLEQISTSDIFIVDSSLTDDKGKFKFKINLNKKYPVFYNIRVKDYNIPLLLCSGEKVQIKSLGNISRNYVVSGSTGTDNIKKFNAKTVRLKEAIDSLNAIYYHDDYNNAAKRDLVENLSVLILQYKQDIIKYVVENSSSLVAVYALYQQYPTGGNIFRIKDDFLYFKMVYDTLVLHFPDSPHVLSLKKDIERSENNMEIENMLASARKNIVSFPEIDLLDMAGNRVKLSSLAGKVVLLDFCIMSHPQSKLNNAELKGIYEIFSGDGFEIYQVALDESRSEWITTLNEQQIKWISVRDFNGSSSISTRLYNVTSLPSNFLIDREGNIVGKDLFGDELTVKIRELL